MPITPFPKDFTDEIAPPLPLLFDRVAEGRVPESDSRLLRLPLEILALVIQQVPEASLASFALVNTDCRQLARSRQFACLSFGYDNKTTAIILKLIGEAVERSSHHGLTHKLALGPCIRRLTVVTTAGWAAHRRDIEKSQSFKALSKSEQSKTLNTASDTFYDTYPPAIELLLSYPPVMPNLELLDWEDTVPLRPSFYDAIANSKIQHLKLPRIPVDKVFAINRPKSRSSGSWPLRNLYLDVISDYYDVNLDVSSLCVSMLQACALNLQSLTWTTCRPDNPLHTDGIEPSTRFPSLRHLRLRCLRFTDDCLLQLLVHDGLKSLELDTKRSSACSQFFDRRGRISALKVFVWHSSHLPESQSLAFLGANPQIAKLSMPFASSPTLLGDHVLPLLVQTFSNLTSLTLVWEGVNIPDEALDRISHITTLKQLHLSAGDQYGWRHDWLIDHEVMRKYLHYLPMLKKLAFSRDSYSNGITATCEAYYSDGLRSSDDLLDENHTREKFEEDHRQYILQIADDYVEEMSQLEWLYFGQITMAVETCVGEGKRNVVRPLKASRTGLFTLLQEIFGWEGLLPY